MNPQQEPPFIPCWSGRDPIRFWISPEMRQFWNPIQVALLTFSFPRERVWLKFVEVADHGMDRCIEFRMEPLFGVLALGMYPPPLNAEPAAGDVIVNADIFSKPQCYPILLPVLVHEIAAHSLGLGHLYLPESVRFPNISEGKINLAQVDRDSLLTIYGV